MGHIQDLLVIGVSMHRHHEAALDRVQVIDNLHRRGQAVGRAGGIRNDMVLGGVILVVIDAQDDGQVFALGRSRDDNFLGAAFGDVVDGAFDDLALLVDAIIFDREDARAFDHDIHAQAAPGDIGRVGFLETLDGLAINQQGVIFHLDRAVEAAVVAIIFQQVRHGGQVADIVESNNFQLIRIIIPDRLENLATNATETVDTYFDRHSNPP